MQIGTIALEELMRGQRQENVEVAGRSTADARLALARKPDAGAILDSLRNVHRQ